MQGEIRVDERPAEHAPTCPYCHAQIAVEDASVWECPECGTRHHDGCARENGRCTLLGCGAPHPRPLRPEGHASAHALGRAVAPGGAGAHGHRIVGVPGPRPDRDAEELVRSATWRAGLSGGGAVALGILLRELGAVDARRGAIILVAGAVFLVIALILGGISSLIRFFHEEEHPFRGLALSAALFALLPLGLLCTIVGTGVFPHVHPTESTALQVLGLVTALVPLVAMTALAKPQRR